MRLGTRSSRVTILLALAEDRLVEQHVEDCDVRLPRDTAGGQVGGLKVKDPSTWTCPPTLRRGSRAGAVGQTALDGYRVQADRRRLGIQQALRRLVGSHLREGGQQQQQQRAGAEQRAGTDRSRLDGSCRGR